MVSKNILVCRLLTGKKISEESEVEGFVGFCAGTRGSLLRGSRRFSGALCAHARKPQIDIAGACATGMSVSDPWGTLEARS